MMLPRSTERMAGISELAGTQDLASLQHEPCPVRQCVRAGGQQEPHHSEQVGVAQQASKCVALVREQTRGAVTVASNDEVGVVEDGSRQREGVAVIDERQPIAVPA